MQVLGILFLISYVGFINFLKSCTFPFTAGFFIFFLSLMFWHLAAHREKSFWATFKYAILFGLGFILIFVAKPATVTAIGQSLTMQSTFYTRIGGLIIILLGAAMLPIKFAEKINLKKWAGWSSLIAGGTFALSWQPCSKVIIPAIQEAAGKEQTLAAGILFLTLIGLGIIVPLLILTVPFSLLGKYLRIPDNVLNAMSSFGGAVLVIIGLLFLTGNISIFFGLLGDIQQTIIK